MAAFNHQLGGQSATMQGFFGVGGLLLTCTSDLSRNRQFGIAGGCAQKPSTATAEGVTAAFVYFRATQLVRAFALGILCF